VRSSRPGIEVRLTNASEAESGRSAAKICFVGAEREAIDQGGPLFRTRAPASFDAEIVPPTTHR
jgi:hypothetical protein